MRGEYRVAQRVERELLEGREFRVVVGLRCATWTDGPRDFVALRVASSTFVEVGINGKSAFGCTHRRGTCYHGPGPH